MHGTNSSAKVPKWFDNKPYIGVVSSYYVGWYKVIYLEDNDKEEMDTEEVKKYNNNFLDSYLVEVIKYRASAVIELSYLLQEEEYSSRNHSGSFFGLDAKHI